MKGQIFDIVLVLAVSALAYRGVIDKTTLLVILGPLVGARVTMLRKGGQGGGGGSAAVALLLGTVALLHGRHES